MPCQVRPARTHSMGHALPARCPPTRQAWPHRSTFRPCPRLAPPIRHAATSHSQSRPGDVPGPAHSARHFAPILALLTCQAEPFRSGRRFWSSYPLPIPRDIPGLTVARQVLLLPARRFTSVLVDPIHPCAACHVTSVHPMRQVAPRQFGPVRLSGSARASSRQANPCLLHSTCQTKPIRRLSPLCPPSLSKRQATPVPARSYHPTPVDMPTRHVPFHPVHICTTGRFDITRAMATCSAKPSQSDATLLAGSRPVTPVHIDVSRPYRYPAPPV